MKPIIFTNLSKYKKNLHLSVQKEENLEVGSGPGITVTKDGAVFATGPGAVVASPM